MIQDLPQLIVLLQGQTVQALELRPGSWAIGRTPDNDLALPHPLVARQHAELRVGEGGVFVTDLESASGTLLDGTRLLPGQPALLEPGGVLQIGPFTLVYQTADAAEPADDEPPLELVPAATVVPVPVAPALSIERVRERLPAPLRRGPYSRYLEFLPMIYHESDFLGRFLLIEEAIWEPLQQRQDHLAMYFDPRTCPEPMLPWLASWLDMTLDPAWPEERRRRLVREGMDLYRWRGTSYGLTRMIELSTGLTPEISDDPERPCVIRVRLRLPAESGISRATIESLIELHKPAHIGYILEVRPT